MNITVLLKNVYNVLENGQYDNITTSEATQTTVYPKIMLVDFILNLPLHPSPRGVIKLSVHLILNPPAPWGAIL